MLVNLSYKSRILKSNDSIELRLEFQPTDVLFENLENINISYAKLDFERNTWSFSFGISQEPQKNVLSISQKIPDNRDPGIYYMSNIRFIYTSSSKKPVLNMHPETDYEQIYIFIGEIEIDEPINSYLNNIVSDILVQRENYQNHAYTTDDSIIEELLKSYSVCVFAVGCLVHSVQFLRGYKIIPLKKGFSYEHMNESVNRYLLRKYNFQLVENPDIAEEYQRSTPLFVVDYAQIRSPDTERAANFALQHSSGIFSLLAYKQGPKPKIYCIILKEIEGDDFKYKYFFPGYRGNLIPGFSPSEHAEFLDKQLDIFLQNDWIRFLFNTYTEANNEEDLSVRYLKYWVFLEIMSKRAPLVKTAVTDALGEPILDKKGNGYTTNSTVGRVYQYVKDLGVTSSNASSSIIGHEFHYLFEGTDFTEAKGGQEKLTLWETINALYAIRNSVAHNGKYDPSSRNGPKWRENIAKSIFFKSPDLLLERIKDYSKQALEREIKSYA